MSNSVDPDETAHRAVSSGSMLFSLQKPVIIARGSEKVIRRHFNMFKLLQQIIFENCLNKDNREKRIEHILAHGSSMFLLDDN